MFPYRDDNPTRGPAVVTAGIVAVNLVVWIFGEGLGAGSALAQAVCRFGLVPGALTGHLAPGTPVPLGEGLTCGVGGAPAWVTPITAMFTHGSWFHLIGNMWFLWLFGDNVEDALGHARYAGFYLATGLAAAAAQVLGDPHSLVPMVGASGAISGVMGAYLILYPTVRVHLLVFLGIFITRVAVPAYVMLGYWFLLQVLGSSFTALGGQGGVAFLAHVGGFLAGVALVLVLQRRGEHGAPSGHLVSRA